MPLYEFKCNKCNLKFEKITPYSKIAEVKCPKCHSNNIKKLVPSSIGLVFKGKGFYKTDYPKKGNQNVS